MAEPYLRIESITKKFDRTLALEDVSLDIQEGEFVFLLGPSGCGKTTLLRIVAGLEVPTSGRILQKGQDITYLSPARRNIGIVFQSYALFPNLTVFQNIAYGLENRKMPKEQIRRRVADLLQLVGLEGYGERYPAQLSGGQQQRVALARALAISPSLLLLDEPLSALDARVRANLRIEVARLQRQLGITTIMVSHDQEEALTMADRVVVMDQGRIAQIGTPEEVYHSPATPFVADFVGLMNFLSGVVVAPELRRVRVGEVDINLHQEIRHPAGQGVLLAIRPEKVQVVESSGDGRENVLRTRVREVEFIGAFYRLHLQLAQAERLIAYLPPQRSSSYSIQEGEEVPIYLPPDQLRVYPKTNSISV
ncbi:MAG: putative 2-aminoethylphosphonate ABC transporter ATP-binding protein [Anaerolineales bacterium]|nr:putative 2-aminoethylphosphonate ABC transporter ATP-binding protein [Anaerolineales bacterium]MCS7247707.1 putative 2-aminoethylphosphonate ABC transporter ATP-binding protein [Anaerolineales bacterium]MDW8161517.1 putative 2-aminoethylphosphonate ABC transporter ATP-binding protein [Anaerolineales bacterium]MDW8446853.1 putative 2-aminoethylphosphonate ABC transporter ATP-binding protein [Anaerolineales bacterium]